MTSTSTSKAEAESAFEPHCFTDTHGVITSTMIDLPGFRVVKVLGAVYGLSVRTRNIATGMWAMMKSTAGGEAKASDSDVSRRLRAMEMMLTSPRPSRR